MLCLGDQTGARFGPRLLLDCPRDSSGHGRGLRAEPPFRLSECAADAAAVVDRLGRGPVTAIGYSMGGAACFARAFPTTPPPRGWSPSSRAAAGATSPRPVESFGRFDSRGWLASVEAPVAVVVNTRDRTLEQEELAAGVDGPRFEFDGDHMAVVGQGRRYAEVMLEAIGALADEGRVRVRRPAA